MPVPLFYPANDGRNICCAQMGRQTGTPGDTLFKFVFCVAAGATKVDQLSCRKCPRTLRRKRSFAVKRIIDVDSLAMMMDTDRYATAQVTNNQIQVFIPDMLCGRISAGNGALVQRMPDSDAGHQRRPCDTGYLIQLLPGAGEDVITKVEGGIYAAPSVTNLLKENPDPAVLLKTVLSDFDMEILSVDPIEYRCYCSRERTERALLSLGSKDLEQIVEEQGGAELSCQFCDKVQTFTADELRAMIADLKARGK